MDGPDIEHDSHVSGRTQGDMQILVHCGEIVERTRKCKKIKVEL